MNEPMLLQVKDLHTNFRTLDGVARAVDGLSFEIAEGETLGLVGESGCGKSVTALSILRLVDRPGQIESGEILLRGRNLLGLSTREMCGVRGGQISMIFQEPMTSLNPVFTVGNQIIEAVRLHQKKGAEEARGLAVDMLRRVGIPNPDQRVDEYPHQLSGGMKQRVMIAMALVCRPALLIADEPTTALDVTIQAEILDLLASLQRDLGMAILLITHNLGIVAGMAKRVLVMYAGRAAEYSPMEDLFENPRHPYTIALFKSIPRLDSERAARLDAIQGQVPSPTHWPTGCRFHPRCPLAIDRCSQEQPPLEEKRPNHWSACWVLK
ncbi:MAG: ABC transporter ATP-binding protein [Candidatus Brocadiia bacterium]|jgi:oligopeptide/dipeptide ABC transporter ATP-binding protein